MKMRRPHDIPLSRQAVAVLRDITAGAEGDEQLQFLIEGIYDQMRGAKLQELLGVDAKGLATVYKRLSRLLTRSKKKVTS